MRLIDADAPELYDKAYVPQDWSGIESYPVMIEWEDIKNAPTVDAVPVRHGEWKATGYAFLRECSKCGKNRMKDNYCSHCGAKMDGGKQDGKTD